MERGLVKGGEVFIDGGRSLSMTREEKCHEAYICS